MATSLNGKKIAILVTDGFSPGARDILRPPALPAPLPVAPTGSRPVRVARGA